MLPLFLSLVFASLTIAAGESGWAISIFQVAVCLLLLFKAVRGRFAAGWILILPCLGLLQLALGSTAYKNATILASLHWVALGSVFLVAYSGKWEKDRFLDWFTAFAGFEAALCLAQLHTSGGRIFWYFPSPAGTDYAYGSFHSYNNFAQFAELAIPVVLYRAFANRTRWGWYALAAGLLYASVIASTSRAGSILVTAEILLLPMFIAWTSRRGRQEAIRQAAWITACIPLLALVWTFAAGWERLAKRFETGDLTAGRKEFFYSAVTMAADKPLLGHGLGTFPHVYPEFSRLDIPLFVNHAHNDWAEFAADGGFLFAAGVFAFFCWSLRGLRRKPWALGVVAVMIHAAVDFPFERPGVSGWMFALLGLAARPKEEEDIAPAWLWTLAAFGTAGAAAALCVGFAEFQYQKDTPQSVALATRWNPWNAEYWRRLADFADSETSLDRARALNPGNASILMQIGLGREIAGDFPAAETLLLDAAQRDKGWLPRWTLANFYFRRGAENKFWEWARKAAAAGGGQDLIPLFRLAENMQPDYATRLLPDQPDALRQFLRYVMREQPTQALLAASSKLLAAGTKVPDRDYVVAVVERFLQAKNPTAAGSLWHGMVEKGWLPAEAGESFSAKPLGEGFDWRMYPADGIVVTPSSGEMTIALSGKQPEAWYPLQRLAQVEPGGRYRLKVRYTTEGVPRESGLRWRVVDELSGEELARSAPLYGESPLKEDFVDFDAKGSQLVRMQLICIREPGAVRSSGAIRLSAAELTRKT